MSTPAERRPDAPGTESRGHRPGSGAPSTYLSSAEAARAYRALRQLDAEQRRAARDGAPVHLEQEVPVQSALLLVEPYVVRGGTCSDALASLLRSLGVLPGGAADHPAPAPARSSATHPR